MTDVTPPNQTAAARPPLAAILTRHAEVILVCVLSAALFSISAHQSGIWEPYESNVTAVAESMVETQSWLQVNGGATGQETEGAASITTLPFEYWPVAVSVSIGGLSEVGLRLPMVLFMTSLLGLLMYIVRLYAGRTAAWCTVLVALCLPLFVFHGRFAFGHGTAIATSAIASLLFIGHARKNCSWLYGLAWMFSACAALSGGILAFAVPSRFLVAFGHTMHDRELHIRGLNLPRLASPLG